MINGDNAKGVRKKIFYFIQRYKKNKQIIKTDKKITLVKANSQLIKKYFKFENTPARNLCDLFLFSLNFKEIERQLKSKLHIFDIGCGSGNYGTMLQKKSGLSFGSYTGLDIYKCKNFPAGFSHVLSSADKIKKYLPKNTNFIFSISALEHIKNDFLVLKKSTEKLHTKSRPFIQIHFIPACAGLWLYLWHGWRQYSFQKLAQYSKKIEKKNKVQTFFIPIGSIYSFFIQMILFTLPKLILRILPYQNKIEKFCLKKLKTIYLFLLEIDVDKEKKLPIFWAFIITSSNLNARKFLP